MKLSRTLPGGSRTASVDPDVASSVAAIVDDVRTRGDDAVAEYARRFDNKEQGPQGYELDQARVAAAAESIDPALRESLSSAAARVRAFHEPQQLRDYDTEGGQLGLRFVPLARVGVYAPGGTATYPSSVIMGVVPAVLAGVDEVVLVTPAATEVTLAAAHIAGVHRVFEIGGAHAVAALAFGTDTVPQVDKIVGPGNQWVAEAKRQVFGHVDIDSVAGPSEVLIVADNSARASWVAADLLAQAEHDVLARPILVSTSEALIAEVEAELDRQLADLPRADIARQALERGGAAVLAGSIAEAVEIAEAFAAEHLELCIEDAAAVARTIRRAGAVFVGHYSPEAAGDYTAGPNHVLPTSGAARFASPLSVYDFVKSVSVIDLSRESLAAQRADIERLAECEGLDAHGRSVTIRFEPGGEGDS